MKRIIIGADMVPTERNEHLFIQGDIEAVVGKELKELFDNADYRVVNLELPLTEEKTPIEKCGPNLIANPKAIEGYKALGIDLVTIANNHILDQGRVGFDKTIETLDKANIAYVGGGYTYEQAYAPKIVEIGGKKIGFYATCQHEFSWVQDYGVGANGFDPLESLDHIVELKSKVDYLVVLYHAGVEEYRYPLPRTRKECRKMIEKGADLIVCQHTHCIDCEEQYKGGIICYGQGNFIFDHSSKETWQTSLLITLDIDGDEFKVGYVPIEKHEEKTALSTNEEILKGYYARSEEIKEEGFIEKKLQEKADGNTRRCYMDGFRGYFDSKFYRFVWKLTKMKCANVLLGKKSRVRIINWLTNPAHTDMIVEGMKCYQRKVWKEENDKNNLF